MERNGIKYKVILRVNFYKIKQNNEMMEILISTDNKILVEASHCDKFLGIGLDEKNEKSKLLEG
jgi:predicted NAD-dependent protein-ADP-ribosyltransferase YbiA (DUF1768 family)